ncbi:MAG: hypothetical protein SOW46_11055 [Candidatus Aphodomonas sp.]|nr:hypothetical protein [Candidatus Aphodomonas sp.]
MTQGRRVKRGETIREAYFQWMVSLVCGERRTDPGAWERLFRLLHETEFTYTLEMDGNRAEDGTDLRYRFAYECGWPAEDVRTYLDGRPCSVFEMMAALAARCEEHIMADPASGNRTGKWFFGMLQSLGLGEMKGGRMDEKRARAILERFLRREYEPDGRGGLFTIKSGRHDMRRIEIWYQMMWYLDEIT